MADDEAGFVFKVYTLESGLFAGFRCGFLRCSGSLRCIGCAASENSENKKMNKSGRSSGCAVQGRLGLGWVRAKKWRGGEKNEGREGGLRFGEMDRLEREEKGGWQSAEPTAERPRRTSF